MPKPKKNESKQDFLSRCTKEVMEKEGKNQDQAYAVCNGLWGQSNDERSVMTLAAPLELEQQGEDDGPESFLITAYTGVDIETWFGTLVFDVAGMQAKAKFPILREHMRDRVVGQSKKSWHDESNFFIRGDFSQSTEDAKEVKDLAVEGFPWQASVSIRPAEIKVLESRKEKATVNGREIMGPAEIWTKSYVGETSFVALGRDDNTAAIVLSDTGEQVPVRIEANQKIMSKEENRMNLTEIKKDFPELYTEIQDEARDEGQQAGKAEGQETERTRVMEILKADAVFETTKKAIEDGISADAAFKLFYEAEKEKRARGLEELNENAPKPAGQEDPPPAPDEEDPDKQMALKARDMAQEKGINIAEAMKQVARENPELAKKAMPVNPVVH